MKNILIIIAKLSIGGAERIARDIGYYADSKKYKIHYLVFGNEVGFYEAELEAKGCIVHHLDSPSKNYVTYYKNLKKLIKDNHIDVIHSHTMFSSGWAMMIGKKLKVPVRMAHSHTIRGPEKRRIWKRIYESVMRMVVIHNSTHLVACGKSAGEWFYGAKTFEEQGILIYNGIGLDEFIYNQTKRNDLRKKHNLDDKFVIGHVGHLATVKNQKFLLELMPQLLKRKPETVLLLLGDGKDREMLEHRIDELGIGDSVLLLGNVNNVGDYMNAMDALAFPSLYEGMPLALVEAQANGLSCCISDRIPKDIYLTDLIQPSSLEEPETWINNICNSKRGCNENYGRQMYAMGFDTKAMLAKIYKLYEGETLCG